MVAHDGGRPAVSGQRVLHAVRAARAFDPRDEGFGDLTVDLSPRTVAAEDATTVSAAEGRRIYQFYGCMACHAIDDSTVTRLGPTWKGLFGSSRTYAKGVLRITADEAYLRESILEPAAKVVSGYERGESGMPSYAGVLNDRQVESVILFRASLELFIKSLNESSSAEP